MSAPDAEDESPQDGDGSGRIDWKYTDDKHQLEIEARSGEPITTRDSTDFRMDTYYEGLDVDVTPWAIAVGEYCPKVDLSVRADEHFQIDVTMTAEEARALAERLLEETARAEEAIELEREHREHVGPSDG